MSVRARAIDVAIASNSLNEESNSRSRSPVRSSVVRAPPMPPPAVLALADGAVSGPVQTQFGWHIVKRNESRVQAAPTLDEVRPQIENQLRNQAVQDSIAEVTEGADIQRNEVEVDPALIRHVGLLTE